MSSSHLSPAVRGRRHRRQLARLPSFGNDIAQEKTPRDNYPRSPGLLDLGNVGDGTDLLDIPVLGDAGGGEGFTQSVTTIVNSVVLPFTTILQTNIATVLVPVESTVPPTANTPTPTSAQQSSTQAQTRSSQTSSSAQTSAPSTASSSTSSSSATSSNSSGASSASSANPSVTPLPSSSTSVVDNGNSFVGTLSSTVTGSAAPTSGADQASTTSSKGLSGGAIGGIVAVSIIAAVVMLVWVIRKIFLRRRAKRHETFVWPKPDFGPGQDRENDISEKMYLRNDGANPPQVPEKLTTLASPTVPALTPPPMSYNNPLPVGAPVQSPTLTAGGAAVSLSPASAGANYACVRCTYIPNLPDELSVTVGETVRVLNEYDDGWTLCLNSHSEQGVVPLECLDRSNAPLKNPGQYLGQGTGDWRMSRRASSLHGAQTAAAVRY